MNSSISDYLESGRGPTAQIHVRQLYLFVFMLNLLLKLSKINLAAGKTFIFHKLRWDMMSQQFDKLFNNFSDLIISILLSS